MSGFGRKTTKMAEPKSPGSPTTPTRSNSNTLSKKDKGGWGLGTLTKKRQMSKKQGKTFTFYAKQFCLQIFKV